MMIHLKLIFISFSALGAIQVLRNAFFLEFWPPPPRNANNVEPYNFVMHFFRESSVT